MATEPPPCSKNALEKSITPDPPMNAVVDGSAVMRIGPSHFMVARRATTPLEVNDICDWKSTTKEELKVTIPPGVMSTIHLELARQATKPGPEIVPPTKMKEFKILMPWEG